MLKRSAQFVSVVMHPLLMPTLLFAILLYFFPTAIQPAQLGGFVLLLIFGMTLVLPALNMLFFKMTGTIHNLSMPNRRERILPAIFVTIVYGAVAAMFYWKLHIPIVFKLMQIITALSLIITISTFFFKISAHAVGACGLAGILLAMATLASATNLIWPALATMIIAGLVMSSRLLLNVHTLSEVTWGGVLGFAIAFGGMVVLF